MPERPQALMRTRCPECGTVFRVTSEQLRRKAGKVRCGQCQAVFNAFDQWQPDDEAVEAKAATAVAVASPVINQPSPPLSEPEMYRPAEPPKSLVPSEQIPPATAAPAPPLDPTVRHEPLRVEPTVPAVVVEESPGTAIPAEPVAQAVSEPVVVVEARLAVPEPDEESTEQSTQAAREAGLVAARELSETAAFNRWAAGTLATDGLGGFASEPSRSVVWPFALVAGLLLLLLLGQLAYHFRSEVVLRMPSALAAYELAGVDIPLSRDAALLSIESSDLQVDKARGLFVLQATLKNRAAHAQAWPALELSLTDVNDKALARRVIHAAEYLPPGTRGDAFPAAAEVDVRLWIEAEELGAAGYRLYIFYP